MSRKSKAGASAPPRGETSASNLAEEANHRIANSLSMIAGMMRAHAAHVGSAPEAIDPADVRAMLAEFASRVENVGRLHRLLAHAKDDSTVDLGDYIQDIATTIVSSLSDGEISDLRFDCEPDCRVPMQSALCLGLIIGEMVTNSVKYAHPTGVPGRIRLACRHSLSNGLEIEVADDGIGLPEGFDPMRSDSMGLRIVRSLADQIGAATAFDSNELGLRFTLRVAARQ